jgi:hypothetical protein
VTYTRKKVTVRRNCSDFFPGYVAFIAVGVHCHDRNLSINKYVREETDAINQNDTWHCVKSVKTALKADS